MAADYEPSGDETAKFFSIIQNKLHFAGTGQTAGELIKSRADHKRQNMGLTSWKDDEIRKTDVTTAKNYLSELEIERTAAIRNRLMIDLADQVVVGHASPGGELEKLLQSIEKPVQSV